MPTEHGAKSAQVPVALHVVVSLDGEVVSADVFQPGVYTVGSADDCDVLLDDEGVAAQHAVLFVEKGRAMLQDCGAGDGLLVNGQPITTCEVSRKDGIRCGPYSLKVYLAQAKQKKKPVEESAKTTAGRRATPRPMPATPAHQQVGARTEIAGPDLMAELSLSAFKPSARAAHARSQPTPHLEPTQLRANHGPTELPAEPRTSPTAPGRKPTSQRLKAIVAKHTPKENLSAVRHDRTRDPLLTLELYWGLVRQQARSYATKEGNVQGAAEDTAGFPMWGFSLPKGGFQLSKSIRKGYRVRIPARANVELKRDGDFYPVRPGDLRTDSAGRFIELQSGGAIRFSEGQMAVVASVNPAPSRPPSQPLKAVPKLPVGLFLCFATMLGALIAVAPSHDELADRKSADVSKVAVKLIMPAEKPPPPPPPEEKVEEPIPEEPPEIVKEEEPPPPPEPKPKKKEKPVQGAGDRPEGSRRGGELRSACRADQGAQGAGEALRRRSGDGRHAGRSGQAGQRPRLQENEDEQLQALRSDRERAGGQRGHRHLRSGRRRRRWPRHPGRGDPPR
jgi:pSer/pThr/pTyr-binding forkhead associated (FHA) protein